MELYTKIPKNILRIFMTSNLSQREIRVLAVVIEKTCGFNKEWDRISLSQFEKFTGLQRTVINDVLGTLVSKKLLAKKTGNAKTPSSWKILDPSLNELLVYKTDTSVQKGSIQNIHSQRKDTKKYIKEKVNKKSGTSTNVHFIPVASWLSPEKKKIVQERGVRGCKACYSGDCYHLIGNEAFET